jgi:hypothetical protein
MHPAHGFLCQRRLRLLFACACRVAHLQFSGEYGPSLSFRSSVKSSLYPFAIAHAAKASKLLFHSSQIVMPLPP